WNYTVIFSDDFCSNYTELIPSQKRQNMTKGFYISICLAALMLLLLVCTLAVTRYIQMRKKTGSLSVVAFHASRNGDLQNTEDMQSRAEDNVYILEDSP
ncbi:hypothetical protein STEG23_007449, partial [Scotinomys teguina]